jgi:hypothetical protein
LGRSIPIVIGTGKVEGIPVIGGAKTIQTPTGYTTEHIGWGPQGGYPPGTTFVGGGFSGFDALIPTYAASQVTALGYLLAFDPVRRRLRAHPRSRSTTRLSMTPKTA